MPRGILWPKNEPKRNSKNRRRGPGVEAAGANRSQRVLQKRYPTRQTGVGIKGEAAADEGEAAADKGEAAVDSGRGWEETTAARDTSKRRDISPVVADTEVELTGGVEEEARAQTTGGGRDPGGVEEEA